MAMVSFSLSSFLLRYGGRQIRLKHVWETGNLWRHSDGNELAIKFPVLLHQKPAHNNSSAAGVRHLHTLERSRKTGEFMSQCHHQQSGAAELLHGTLWGVCGALPTAEKFLSNKSSSVHQNHLTLLNHQNHLTRHVSHGVLSFLFNHKRCLLELLLDLFRRVCVSSSWIALAEPTEGANSISKLTEQIETFSFCFYGV